MPIAKVRKKKGSTPAWETCQTHEAADYFIKTQSEEFGTYADLQPLLEKSLKSPVSLNHRQETQLDKHLKLMTHLPPDDKEKLKAICALATDGSTNALRILVYLTDPNKVGKDR